ncbi:DUF3152 domain-containing protein [Micromonospora rifamycinica]|uniref:Uncharacterized protein n=1 Tax=Micromonospora rifamycinica TaxID=291594 RepID=A0A109IIT2_9ACTN|nr:DUF3152 domain-containing protein [Micromonospora rifamycinica]KWV31350.1 hypothetical protein AWV63_18095 [Micromonospora rifamycinica]SCG80351.1 Protein of unknown function [Micromonospora rifamycinica]
MATKGSPHRGSGRFRRPAAALLVAGWLAGCGVPTTADRAAAGPADPAAAAGPTASGGPAAAVGGVPLAATGGPVAAGGGTTAGRAGTAPVSYPADGSNRWQVAAGEPAAPTGTGRLVRYRVAVERDIRGLPVAGFAAEVGATLTAPQGWASGGRLRLWRVGPGGPADFTVHLATPGTRDELCGDAADGYTSCRNGDRVVVNVARWVKGVPGYGASLETYRRYVVNHEVGHRLGHGHERCPGRGRPAPVMQQQTLGLHGCTANAWPYRDGRRYAGPAGSYADAIPPREPGRRG